MGAYLPKPNTEKVSSEESFDHVEYGVSMMQGWRVGMEDAHCCLPNLKDTKNGLYAVFDGHGGREVAEYCAQNFEKFLLDTEAFDEGKMEKALRETFMNIDEALLSEEVIKELQAIIEDDDDEEDDDEEGSDDEAAMLLKEANTPLEEVLKQFQDAANKRLQEKLAEKGEAENDEKPANGEAKEETQKSSKSRKQKAPVKRVEEVKPTESEETETNGEVTSNNEPPANGESTNGSGGSSKVEESTTGGSSAVELGGSANVVNGEKHEEQKVEDVADDDDDDDEEEGYSSGSSDDDDDDDDDEMFQNHNDVEFESGTQEPGRDSGTTAIVALVYNNKLYVANAGDSRCILCRSGKAVEMSFDHKPEDEPERSRIENAGMSITQDGRVNGGLNLSRALGDHLYKRNKDLSPEEQAITALPDIKEIELTKDDTFMVLACDGIWGMMTNEEVIEYVHKRLDTDKETSLSKICEEIFDKCLSPNTDNDGSGCDNMTCLIVRFKHDGSLTTSTASSGKRQLSEDEETSQKSKKAKK